MFISRWLSVCDSHHYVESQIFYNGDKFIREASSQSLHCLIHIEQLPYIGIDKFSSVQPACCNEIHMGINLVNYKMSIGECTFPSSDKHCWIFTLLNHKSLLAQGNSPGLTGIATTGVDTGVSNRAMWTGHGAAAAAAGGVKATAAGVLQGGTTRPTSPDAGCWRKRWFDCQQSSGYFFSVWRRLLQLMKKKTRA